MNPLATAEVGRTGLRVTRMGLGGAPLGGLFSTVEEAEALGTVRLAHERGLRYFDTAPYYGAGRSEQRFGEVLKGYPRDELVISTKVGRVLEPAAPGELDDWNFRGDFTHKPVFDFSYDGVMRSFEDSLRRTGLERFDFLYVHDPDDYQREALEGAFPALHRLREQGLVRAIGAGMNQAEMLTTFARHAEPDCLLVAGRYTLLDQIAMDALLPACAERGISMIVGGAYNSGILATGARPGATYNYEPAPPEIVQRTGRIEALCAEHGVPLKAAALQFPMAHPAAASVLIGARSRAEVEENLAMFQHEIPRAFWEALRHEGLVREAAPLPGD